MGKTPEEMAASMIGAIEGKTGKPLAQWLKLVRARQLSKHGEIVKLLKTEHGMTHGYANLIATKALEGARAPSGRDLVDAQFAGDKAALEPIYDAVVAAALKLGKDVEVSPKKTYVSLRRNKQFAIVQPSTKTRVDVGLCLKGVPAKGRLEKAGSFNSMVSHRVRLTKKSDVDRELKDWLEKAYETS